MLARPSALILAVVAVAVAGVSSCGDTAGVNASFTNIDSRLTVFAVNGTPVSLPTAVRVRSAQAVRMDASFLFDLAFDFDATGQVIVYTQGYLATDLDPIHRVGILPTGQAFEAATRAPSVGYVYDSTMVLPVGQTVYLDVGDIICSGSFIGQTLRGKMVIDSVNVADKALYLHVLSNPNCGFRSLVAGGELPKD